MFGINELVTFFGWCTLINSAIYLFSALFIFVFKNFTTNMHSNMSGVSPTELPNLYFNYLGNFKIGILLFNLAPYIALKLMV
jgi:hypothetical protein